MEKEDRGLQWVSFGGVRVKGGRVRMQNLKAILKKYLFFSTFLIKHFVLFCLIKFWLRDELH